VASLHGTKAARDGGKVRYPGERTLLVRAENMKLGLPVDEAVWAGIVEEQGTVTRDEGLGTREQGLEKPAG
jgi:LDH2 family malate/lactate/ureidoglycolate dehydrogenase